MDALKTVQQACVDAHKASGLKEGGEFASIQLDVSDKAAVAALWSKVPTSLRNVDILGVCLSFRPQIASFSSIDS